MNQEIFDIKDSKELSSLLLAMELQSETLPEIDGVPLNIYLSSINENNKIIDIFQESQYDEFNNGNEINPDHMTYEVKYIVKN